MTATKYEAETRKRLTGRHGEAGKYCRCDRSWPCVEDADIRAALAERTRLREENERLVFIVNDRQERGNEHLARAEAAEAELAAAREQVRVLRESLRQVAPRVVDGLPCYARIGTVVRVKRWGTMNGVPPSAPPRRSHDPA